MDSLAPRRFTPVAPAVAGWQFLACFPRGLTACVFALNTRTSGTTYRSGLHASAGPPVWLPAESSGVVRPAARVARRTQVLRRRGAPHGSGRAARRWPGPAAAARRLHRASARARVFGLWQSGHEFCPAGPSAICAFLWIARVLPFCPFSRRGLVCTLSVSKSSSFIGEVSPGSFVCPRRESLVSHFLVCL